MLKISRDYSQSECAYFLPVTIGTLNIFLYLYRLNELHVSRSPFKSLWWSGVFCIISLLPSLQGCRKSIEVHDPGIGRMEDLDVHPDFNWQTFTEADLDITIDLPSMAPGDLSRIDVYQGNPSVNGRLLLSGSAGYGFPFNAKLRVSATVSSVFLRMTTNDGLSQTVEVPVEKTITYTFTGSRQPAGPGFTPAGTGCQSGCDALLSGSGSFIINDGNTYCITDSYSGHITIRKGRLKICGTFTGTVSMGQEENICELLVTPEGSALINTLSMSRNCTLVISGNGYLSLGSLAMIQNAVLKNEGYFEINNNFTHPDMVLNTGTMVINGQYTVEDAAKLENYGSITVSSDWIVGGDVVNSGGIEVFGDIHFNAEEVRNYCFIKSYQEVVFNNMIYTANNGYISGVIAVTVNPGAGVTVQNQSMISTSHFVLKNNLRGSGSASVVKCTMSGSITGSQTFVSGPVEMLTPDGTLLEGGYPENFKEQAILRPLAEATAFIPAGECNPEGSGHLATGDSDGDGVTDQLDNFPLDGTRAFISWYPEASGFGTLIFEDLWPYQGDYDMNDAVIDYQFRVITNARNQVSDILSKFYLRAAGATLKNGFGFQLDRIQPASVAAVSGYVFKFDYIKLNPNGTESEQDRAVIIAWDNADNIIHRVGPRSEFNTLPDYPAGHSDSVSILIHFAIPQNQVLVGSPPYNPFLIKSLNRSLEIHMPDYIPTSLANPTYFGTADDDSDPAAGRYYKTEKNLLWATSITEKYHYTYETIEVLWGYYHFAEWCEASGKSYPDWYRDLPGYRKENYIYDIIF